jgi:hypothetical protein
VLVVRSAPSFGTAGLTSCNPDYSYRAARYLITQWTPVKNLTFSADFTYAHRGPELSLARSRIRAALASANRAAVYELKNQDTVLLLLLRAQRNW